MRSSADKSLPTKTEDDYPQIKEKLEKALKPEPEVLSYHPVVTFPPNYQKLFVRKNFDMELESDRPFHAFLICQPRDKKIDAPEKPFDPLNAIMKETSFKPRVQQHMVQAYYVGPLLVEWAEKAPGSQEEIARLMSCLMESDLCEIIGAQQKVLLEGMYSALAGKKSECVVHMMNVKSKPRKIIKASNWWTLLLLDHAAKVDT